MSSRQVGLRRELRRRRRAQGDHFGQEQQFFEQATSFAVRARNETKPIRPEHLSLHWRPTGPEQSRD